MPFFLWERLSAAKIAPVVGEIMLFFASGSCATKFSVYPSSPLKLRGDRGGLCAFAASSEIFLGHGWNAPE